MLIKMRDYCMKQGSVRLPDLADYMQLPASAVEAMMQHWIRKGIIQLSHEAPSCNGCVQSCQQAVPVYEVIG